MAKNTKRTCVLCGEQKAEYLMAKDRNEDLNPKFGYCLDCIKKVSYEEHGEINALRMLNIPYINDIWDRAKMDAPDNPMSKYFQLIAPKKMFKTYLDSDFGKSISGDSTIKISEEVINRWGTGDEWTDDKYIEYELALEDLKKIKMPQTALEEKRYIENVRIGKRLQNEIEYGKAADIKSLSAVYTNGLKELGLDIDSTGNNEKTIGELIADWEKNAPLPELGVEFQDVDKIGFYMNKFFLIPMKRMFNQASREELEILYDDTNNENPDE